MCDVDGRATGCELLSCFGPVRTNELGGYVSGLDAPEGVACFASSGLTQTCTLGLPAGSPAGVNGEVVWAPKARCGLADPWDGSLNGARGVPELRPGRVMTCPGAADAERPPDDAPPCSWPAPRTG